MHPTNTLVLILLVVALYYFDAGVESKKSSKKKQNNYQNSGSGANNVHIDYYLYRSSQRNGMRLSNGKLPSDYNHSLRTFVIYHGMGGSYQSNCQTTIRNALLDHGNYNIIVPNYTNSSRLYTLLYQEVARRTANVLVREGVRPTSTTAIGSSLGSHIAGLMRRRGGFTPNEIYALDPAGPVFDTLPNAQRLSTQSAGYVQVYHTNTGVLGAESPLGNDDIYVNGGNDYPCCRTDPCRHNGACDIFARTIRNGPQQARVCNNVKEARSSSCRGSTVDVGLGSRRSGERVSHLTVRGCSPRTDSLLKDLTVLDSLEMEEAQAKPVAFSNNS